MNRPIKIEERDRRFSEAVKNHRGRLLSMIRSRIRDRIEAEDILEDVFLEVLETYDLGRAIENLGAWLFKVAKNKIIDRFRKRKTRQEYQRLRLATAEAEKTSVANPDDEWTRVWLREEIVNALEMLPKEQRDVFVAHELEGKSFEKIAAEAGVSVNTLLSRKRYAVIFLREHLKEVHDGLE